MTSLDKPFFFDAVRKSLFGGRLNQDQVEVLETLIDHFNVAVLGDVERAQLAYVMATTYHEVGRDLMPKSENLNYTTAARIQKVWPSRFKTAAAAQPFVGDPIALANKVYGGRGGNTREGDGWRYRGRGFAQITFRDNYRRLGELIAADLVSNPDLALNPKIAADILIEGMIGGLFTGKRLIDYIGPVKTDFVNARRIINADVAANGKKIAGYAAKFLAAMRLPA